MKSRNYRLIALLLILAGMGVGSLLPGEVGAAETTPISLSGAVYRGNEPDLGLTDLWLATLSKQPTLKVLERADLRAILGELSLAGVSDDSARQVRLGRLLGVECFAWIKASDEQALMEVVEAATGRGVAVIPVRFVKGHFADILPKLAEQAVQTLSRPMSVSSQVAPSIAFSIPRFSVSNAAVQASVETVIADLSGAWAGSGITMLSRRFAADAVQERWRQEKGLVEDISQGQAFLGADYILGVSVDATNRIEFVMVETATGRRVGKKEMPMEEAQTADGLKTVKQWELDRLKPLLERPSVLPPAAVTNGHYTAPERLKPLYAGMVLHNEGRYLDALSKLREAQSMQDHLDEAFNWIASCYKLAGFPEIADGLISYVDHVSTRNVLLFGQSFELKRQTLNQGLPFEGQTLNEQSEPGMILLGATSDAGIPRGLAERMGMLLIDRLHEASGTTVLAAEDIAGLRDEYDLLLGLDKVKGTTWRKAPAILPKEAVTAHLESGDGGLRLRLCLIRDCNPTSIYDAVTTLPADQAQWPAAIDKPVRVLLTKNDSAPASWSPPPVIIKEKQAQLVEQLEATFNPYTSLINMDTYLKALTRDPTLTKYRAKVEWRMELDRWFLRVLPEGHADYRLVEFAFATNRPAFQRLAEKYPNDPVGIFSRYNVALIDMTPTNLAAAQTEISAVVAAFKPFDRKKYVYIDSVCAMDSALRYALGLPGGKPENAFYGGLITTAQLERNRVIEPDFGPVSQFNLLQGSFFEPRTPDQVRADLEALCHISHYGVIPSWFLRRFIDQQGTNSELTQYAVLKYIDIMTIGLYKKQEWTEEDLCVIYQAFPDLYCQVKARDPNSISMNVSYDVNNGRYILGMPKIPAVINAFQQALRTIEKSVLDAKVSVTKRSFASLDEAWKLGPLKDSSCLDFDYYEQGKCYVRYLARLHELYDGEVKSKAICRLYCQFGLAFFRMERYDLAEPLFEQIISWRDYKNRPPEIESHAMSLYLLALLKQRNGDPVTALRLAKEAVDFMDAHPKMSLAMYWTMNINGGGHAIGSLKVYAIEFIKQIRENSKMPFRNPYRPSYKL